MDELVKTLYETYNALLPVKDIILVSCVHVGSFAANYLHAYFSEKKHVEFYNSESKSSRSDLLYSTITGTLDGLLTGSITLGITIGIGSMVGRVVARSRAYNNHNTLTSTQKALKGLKNF